MRFCLRPPSTVTLCLMMILFLQAFVTANNGTTTLPSPIDLHAALRETLRQGLSPRSDFLSSWVERTGDRSLESLMAYSAEKQQGIRLEAKAFFEWEKGDRRSARRLYERAAQSFLAESAWSEAAFCLYYVAEILAEQERYSECLKQIEQAFTVIRARSCLYLEALLYESRGYCLWYADQLPAAVQSFGQAQQRWRQLDYSEGLVTAWNNMAILYEELRLVEQAREAYDRALESADAAMAPQILFQLHANYASFLSKETAPRLSMLQLEAARSWSSLFPFEFLLLECEVLKTSDCRDRLIGFPVDLPSRQVERSLLLAEQAEDPVQARGYFERAAALSRSYRLGYLFRRTCLSMGRWLEEKGRFSEAADLYREGISRTHLGTTEYILPYSRVESPLLDGLVRSLIRAGRQEEAHSAIGDSTRRRQQRARALMLDPPAPLFRKDPMDRFSELLRVEAAGLDFTISSEERSDPVEAIRPAGFVMLELWPDQNHLYAWVRSPDGIFFRELDLGRDAGSWISAVAGGFYQAQESLPPPPSPRELQDLYRRIFAPLEPLLETERLLVIPHKQLQLLPLEMLLDDTGRFLGDRYHFSYLPGDVQPVLAAVNDAPLAILPPLGSFAGVIDEEAFYRKLFPRAEIVRGLQRDGRSTARWIHVSSHFGLINGFWLGSGFEAGSQELRLASFLARPFRSRLLSLGVCDAGNAFSSGSPYWLGLAELLLTRPVGALLVSRWKMDEFSAGIYRDFFLEARTGIPMDLALARAQKRFRKKILQRRGQRVSGEHPFFWAGISYVGLPGVSLYDTPRADLRLFWLSLSLLVVAVCVARPSSPRFSVDPRR